MSVSGRDSKKLREEDKQIYVTFSLQMSGVIQNNAQWFDKIIQIRLFRNDYMMSKLLIGAALHHMF